MPSFHLQAATPPKRNLIPRHPAYYPTWTYNKQRLQHTNSQYATKPTAYLHRQVGTQYIPRRFSSSKLLWQRSACPPCIDSNREKTICRWWPTHDPQIKSCTPPRSTTLCNSLLADVAAWKQKPSSQTMATEARLGTDRGYCLLHWEQSPHGTAEGQYLTDCSTRYSQSRPAKQTGCNDECATQTYMRYL